ncbi:MAG: sulfatase-like hydrolase/transferase [Alphaproteobacteria bacterium]|nr:sulfatase-like hydrolase/transferase [Alphaproteobacteria bacterium]
MNKRVALLSVLLLLASSGLAVQTGTHHTLLAPLHRATAGLYEASPPEKTVVFVVLDTVRADRLHACGYARPTTPTLDGLVANGASLTCEARAPGSWTLPSHASFFTGLPVHEHQTDKTSGGCETDCFGVNGAGAHRLEPGFPVLAEALSARGYQTAMISSNPVVSHFSGLDRGFDVVHAAGAWGELRGADLLAQVRSTLRHDLDPERPLFLFVNIAEAHDPFLGVPYMHPYLPARWMRDYSRDEGSEWERLLADTLDPAEREDLLAHLGDLYDYGIERADGALGGVVDLLERHGWTKAGVRLVVVSDHGEYLGEHGLFDHGVDLLEPQQRVPLLVYDTDGAPTLPGGPISALAAHDLVKEGRLPATPAPVVASTSRSPWFALRHHLHIGASAAAAEWLGDAKTLVHADGAVHTDLSADPGEARYAPVAPHEGLLPVEVLYRQADALDRSVTDDAELVQMLKAAGYLEE